MKRCRKCILPVNFPHIVFDRSGVCNLCRDYTGRKKAEELKSKYKRRFEQLVKRCKGIGVYDILFCYSGGKDSTYTLKMLKEIYKLRILAFTFDNGFLPDRTFINIKSVVENMDVDHLLFKPRFDILKRLFKESARRSLYPPKTLERASTICTTCIGMVKYMSLKLAIEKEIPLVGFGWSPGQAPVTSSILKIDSEMVRGMERVTKAPVSKVIGRDINAYFLNERDYRKTDKFPTFVHPLAFHGYDEKKILSEIKPLGWKMPAGLDLNATNCLLNSLADQVHIHKYNFHPYVSEIAALVREGYMTRQEGLRHIPFEKNPRIIRLVKRRLGILRKRR